jgi:hypothetical protein
MASPTFFAANQQPSQLYLNRGQLRFENVSHAAGLPTDSAWSTGVSVTDINNDGLPDLYICRAANYELVGGNRPIAHTYIQSPFITLYKLFQKLKASFPAL